MLIDCHVHLTLDGGKGGMQDYIKNLDECGVDKTILFSDRPASFLVDGEAVPTSGERLSEIMAWSAFSDRIIPFFWIDPLDEDAFEQVDKAVEAGIRGFKVICNRHTPYDDRPMEVWNYIAKKGKPILFHSGILYSSRPASRFNRPANFEPLFDIPGLKFTMAHVSWPWVDECLAVFGYWCSRKRKNSTTAEMFIDTTPGTPSFYRDEALTKIYTIGYAIEDNVMFGSDCSSNYNMDRLKTTLQRDKVPLDRNGVSAETREKYYHKNVLRFLGV